MPEARERKENDKIKGKGGIKSSTKKSDVRRQMTAKFRKELVERQRGRDAGGNTDTAPEVQAAEQIEEKIYTTADSIREHTSDALTKSVSRHRRKEQKKKRRTESVSSEPPTADAEPAPPPARENIRQKAPDDMRTRTAEVRRDPAYPLREYRPNKIRERPTEPHPDRMRTPKGTRRPAAKQTREFSPSEDQHSKIATPHTDKGRLSAKASRPDMEREATPPLTRKADMRQTAVTEKRKQHGESRERTIRAQEGHTSQFKSPHKPITPDSRSEYIPPKPQERMRKQIVADAQRNIGRRNKIESVQPIQNVNLPTTPKGIVERKSAPLVNQSINPIKERPRRSFPLREKPAGGSFIPKTRQSTAAIRSSAQAIPGVKKGKAAVRPLERMRQRVQRNAQRKLLQHSKRATKATVDLSRKIFAAITKAASSAISALAGLVGGAVLIPVFCLIIFAAAILASPFGILFANEPAPDAVPLNVAVGNLNMELSNQLELLQSGDYNSFDVQGQGPDWREVVAVFAVKTAGADDGVDVAALTPDRVERLKTVFWDMCAVTSEVETIDHPDSDPDDDTDDSWTESILHITITAKSADDMRTEYAFTDYQNEALTELLAELATVDILLTDLSAIEGQARELLQRLPDSLSPDRRAAVETACRLVGKVNYFWGGKSLVIGWDSRWGTMQKVWAAGSPSTGTYRPYGMDCSGFVDWVFYNMSGGSYIIGHGGGAHAQHTYCQAITWDEAQPGDLVFYPSDTHVGIVGGWDEDGNILIIHCASGQNNVVITGQAGFTTIGRPLYYGE